MPHYDEVANRDVFVDDHRGTSQREKIYDSVDNENDAAILHIPNSWDDVSRSLEEERGWFEEPV